MGLGPGIQLSGQGIWFRVNSYIETDVRNRPKLCQAGTPNRRTPLQQD